MYFISRLTWTIKLKYFYEGIHIQDVPPWFTDAYISINIEYFNFFLFVIVLNMRGKQILLKFKLLSLTLKKNEKIAFILLISMKIKCH